MSEQNKIGNVVPNSDASKIPGVDIIAFAIEGAARRQDVFLHVVAVIRTGNSIETELLGEYGEEKPGFQLCRSIAEFDNSESCQHCWKSWATYMVEQNCKEYIFECPFGLLSVGYLKHVRGNLYLVAFGGTWLELGGEGRLYQSFSRLECDDSTRGKLINLADQLTPLTLKDRASRLARLKPVAEQVSAVVSGFYDGEFALARNKLVTLFLEHDWPIYDMESLSSFLHDMLVKAANMIYRDQLSILTSLDPYDNYVRFLASSIEDVGPQHNIVLKGVPVGTLEEWIGKKTEEIATFVQQHLNSIHGEHESFTNKIKELSKTAHILKIENGTYAALIVGTYTEPRSPRERWEHAVFGEDLEKELLNLVAELLQKIYRSQGFLKFVTRLTHTIRQPLNDIAGNADSVRQGLLSNAGTLELIRQLRAIEQTIDDVTIQLDDLTRALRGGIPGTKPEIALQEHSLHDLIKKAVGAARLRLERGIKIDIQGEEMSVENGRMDFNQMLIVMDNLLDNALKYAHFNTPITVTYGTFDNKGKDGTWFFVSIKDFGIGFYDDEKDRIFLPFTQGRKRDPMRSILGSRMGLAFVRAIIEAHGGEVIAECTGSGPGFDSREHCKVTFTIKWPVNPQQSRRSENDSMGRR